MSLRYFAEKNYGNDWYVDFEIATDLRGNEVAIQPKRMLKYKCQLCFECNNFIENYYNTYHIWCGPYLKLNEYRVSHFKKFILLEVMNKNKCGNYKSK